MKTTKTFDPAVAESIARSTLPAKGSTKHIELIRSAKALADAILSSESMVAETMGLSPEATKVLAAVTVAGAEHAHDFVAIAMADPGNPEAVLMKQMALAGINTESAAFRDCYRACAGYEEVRAAMLAALEKAVDRFAGAVDRFVDLFEPNPALPGVSSNPSGDVWVTRVVDDTTVH